MSAIAPSAASTIYNVNYQFFGHFDYNNTLAGYIVTDDTLGALLPTSIVEWDVTRTSDRPGPGPGGRFVTVTHASSDSNGPMTWAPGSFTATPDALVFDFGPGFTASLTIPTIVGFFTGSAPAGCGPGCGAIVGPTSWFTNAEFHTLARYYGTEDVATVPAPVAGIGLPGVLFGALGWLGWRRRRLKSLPRDGQPIDETDRH